MNYYALFLNNSSYIEKCLSLIRYISNPNSKSLPHITLRTYKTPNSRLDDLKNKNISYLNLIEPGNFNIEDNNPPYIIYIQCESEEIEGIEYKPDYPFSRLHITLYEGNNIYYAKELYSLLSKRDWHFKLVFKGSHKLVNNKIGSTIPNKYMLNNVGELFDELAGVKYNDYLQNCQDDNCKLKIVNIILDSLFNSIDSKQEELVQIESNYFNKYDLNIVQRENPQTRYIDASRSNITYKENQLSFDDIYPNITPFVEKPCQDNIFVTPPEYANDMAKCALEAISNDFRGIDFGDSAIGTGVLFLALKKEIDKVNMSISKGYNLESAIGIDIDEHMAKEAFLRYGKRGLNVIYGDSISPDIKLGSCRNLMLVNPPYNRHEDIPKEYREQIQNLAKKQTGIKVMGDAGLYVYHLLIMDKWLCSNGVAVWLLPSFFLQSRYGRAVRDYLSKNVQLLRLHIYNEDKLQFDDTLISTSIVVFKKRSPNESDKIMISYGDSVKNPKIKKIINNMLLKDYKDNWRRIVYDSKEKELDKRPDNVIIFEELFNIKRGLATGANSFFVLDRNKALELGIPNNAIKPLLPKARYLNSFIINKKDDGYPDVKPQLVLIDCDLNEETIRVQYPLFYEYLQKAKVKAGGEKPIIERALVKSRKPWYKQEVREAPLFLFTYMGRNKSDMPALYFLLNKSKATALNTYLLLYPRKWLEKLLDDNELLYEMILNALNQSAKEIITTQTRIYSGGLQKLEPGELKGLPIVGLPKEILNAYKLNKGN